jgi:hypothetical protein
LPQINTDDHRFFAVRGADGFETTGMRVGLHDGSVFNALLVSPSNHPINRKAATPARSHPRHCGGVCGTASVPQRGVGSETPQ